MESSKQKPKRAPRTKKAVAAVPVADSVVSAFGGAVAPVVVPEATANPNAATASPNPAIFIEEVEEVVVVAIDPKTKNSRKK